MNTKPIGPPTKATHGVAAVAQGCALLYRRVALCGGGDFAVVHDHFRPPPHSQPCRVEPGDTAELNSALRRIRAFTVLEVAVVIAVVALLAVIAVPVLRRVAEKARRVMCGNNLKHIGLDARIWASDHGDLFPAEFYTNAAGGLRFADATNGFRLFQVMSNELGSPKVLHCPSDSGRSSAAEFTSGFGAANVSYFMGLDADEAAPGIFLAGDRNVTNGMPVKNGVLTLVTNLPAGWSMEIHQGAGNLGFGEGTVKLLNSAGLNSALGDCGTNSFRLWIP